MSPSAPADELLRLQTAFTDLVGLRIGWSGNVYRGAKPPYHTDPEFLDGQGSRRGGNRWNPPGVCAVVYTCLEVDNVIPEALAHARAYGIAVEDDLPTVVRWVACQLSAVVDLRDPATQAALGLDMPAMMAENWRAVMSFGGQARTQVAGHAAYLAGLEGLLVQSVVNSSLTNLVVFRDNLLSGSAITPGPGV